MISADQITIIMPAYNMENYIEQAIHSVQSQLTGGFHIMVADDGSSDQTAKIAKASGATVFLSEHKGAAHARNIALKQLSTPFFLFLDADDILSENAMEAFICAMETDSTCMAVCGLAKDFISPELDMQEQKKLKPNLQPYSGILPGCTFLRREVYDKIGGFMEQYSPGEVVGWMIRLRTSNMRITRLNRVTLYRRLHMNNSGRLDKQIEARNYAAILRARMKTRKAE